MQVEVVSADPVDEAPSIDPNVWGPPLWDLLFSLIFRSDEKSVADLQHIFVLLEKVMPCSHCRRSYALYRKQLRPTSVVTDTDSAALWLWTIHDMVNQKLGKICISYDKLVKRHRAHAILTNDLIVIDLLGLIAEASRPNKRELVVDLTMAVARILERVNPTYFRLPTFLRRGPLRIDHLQLDLHRLSNELRADRGFAPRDFDAYKEELRQAYA